MFRQLPTIVYPYDGGVELAATIMAALPLRLNVDRTFMIERRLVGDGETPESLAYKLYKNVDFHWTLLVINKIRDPYTEWPMESDVIKSYSDLKHRCDSTSTIKTFIDLRDGSEVDDLTKADLVAAGIPYPVHMQPVSFFEYENQRNDERRNIIAITPAHIHTFVDMYEDAVKARL